jgi:hypothetical protein
MERAYFVDLDSGHLLGAPDASGPVLLLPRIKRGATFTLPIQFLSGRIVQELSAGASGTLGFKPLGQYDNGTYAAAAGSWVKTGTGMSALYTFSVTFINSVMNALFNINGDPSDDVASVDLGGEIKWIDSSGTHETAPDFKLTVLNDINRGGEVIPITPLGLAPYYLPNVTALLGNIVMNGVPTTLDAVPTIGMFQAGNLLFLLINGSISMWVFSTGAADPTDPGQVAPVDYNATTNNFHWQKSGGY